MTARRDGNGKFIPGKVAADQITLLAGERDLIEKLRVLQHAAIMAKSADRNYRKAYEERDDANDALATARENFDCARYDLLND